jgi:TRAP-type C4-dicarboxylate transport system substrate-binding protein
MKLIYPILLSLIISSPLFAKVRLKLAVVAPEDTSWSKNLTKMAKDIKEYTKGEVRLKIYFGGVMGDEPDVLRKIRVGQLQGGIFTGKTLGEINGDVRVMEIPYTFFNDRKKALQTLNALSPSLNKKFTKNEFINIGFFELGMVYFVSVLPTKQLKDLKGQKIWSWQGDELVNNMMKNMNLISVPLPLTDVLSSLQTGIIQAAYAPPLGIIALQWHTKVKYLIDFPLAFSLGAMLLSKKAWKKIKPEHQAYILKTAKKYVQQINESNNKENEDALAAMKDMGIKFIKFSDSEIKEAKAVRKTVIKQLQGKLFSKEVYQKMEEKLSEVPSSKS